MSDPRMGYYSIRKSCGHVIMATVNADENRLESATEVAKAIRRGEVLLTASIEAIRKMHWCDCKK